MKDNILRGHTSLETAYVVNGHPYGYKMTCAKYYWIESVKNKGDRICSCTINPQSGDMNAVKYSTYSPFKVLMHDVRGKVEHSNIISFKTEIFKREIQFIVEVIGEEFINDIQKDNIRKAYLAECQASLPLLIKDYPPELHDEFKKWLTSVLQHIQKCKFKDLANHKAPPSNVK